MDHGAPFTLFRFEASRNSLVAFSFRSLTLPQGTSFDWTLLDAVLCTEISAILDYVRPVWEGLSRRRYDRPVKYSTFVALMFRSIILSLLSRGAHPPPSPAALIRDSVQHFVDQSSVTTMCCLVAQRILIHDGMPDSAVGDAIIAAMDYGRLIISRPASIYLNFHHPNEYPLPDIPRDSRFISGLPLLLRRATYPEKFLSAAERRILARRNELCKKLSHLTALLPAMPTSFTLQPRTDSTVPLDLSALIASTLPGSSVSNVDSGAFPHVENEEGMAGFVTRRSDPNTKVITGTDTASSLICIGTHVQYVLASPPERRIITLRRENVMAPHGWIWVDPLAQMIG